MFLAFEKPNPKSNFFQRMAEKAVALFTDGPYTHVEVVFNNDAVLTHALCFSATPQLGARFAYVDISASNWTYVKIATTTDEDSAALKDAMALTAKDTHYDWLAIMDFVLPLGEHEVNGAICSELADEIVTDECGKITALKPWQVSPNKLYSILVK